LVAATARSTPAGATAPKAAAATTPVAATALTIAAKAAATTAAITAGTTATATIAAAVAVSARTARTAGPAACAARKIAAELALGPEFALPAPAWPALAVTLFPTFAKFVVVAAARLAHHFKTLSQTQK
jgi:hypothetical protein